MSLSSWSSSEKLQEDSKGGAFRALNWFAFGLEVLGGIIVVITAIYLRLADLHPTSSNVNWKVVCPDVSLTYYKPDGDDPILLYTIILVVPVVFILILELEQTVFSESSYFDGMNKSERMCKSLPRWGRVLAMFILGIFLASFFADYLKIVVVRPRPYFVTVYGTNCPSAYNGTRGNDFYNALKSFPSHLATVASFCCMFAVSYAHGVREAFNSSVLVPIMSQGFLVLAVTASLDRYTSHFNHMSDIIGGLIIGVLLAIYMSSLVSFKEKIPTVKQNESNWTNFWSSLIPRARVSLPPTTAEARNVMSR